MVLIIFIYYMHAWCIYSCSEYVEGTALLSYDEGAFRVHDDQGVLQPYPVSIIDWHNNKLGERFRVVHQSDKCILSGDVVPLFCVASGHSTTYKYCWSNSSGDVGMFGPVLFAAKPGLYRCTIENKLTDATCKSSNITVTGTTVII